MYWTVLIYIAGMVAFNLFGKTGNVFWAVQYYTFIHGVIAVLAFEQAKIQVLPGRRKLYKILGYFSIWYAVFHLAALSGGSIEKFLDWSDSYLWSLVSAIIALVLLISYFRHDKHAKNGRD